jgi:hypothetical protein
MWSYRKPRGGLERALRSQRSEPRDEFVQTLSGRVDAARPRARHAWSRLAFAGALSTLIVGMFASFGGLSYTASGASSTYQAVKQVVAKQKVTVRVHRSSASAQYGSTPAAPAPAQHVAGATQQQSSGVAAATAGKTLPFTGYSLVGTVVLSLILIAAGLMLRRRERRST